SADDLDRLTRSDVDAWLGRVHHVRGAALVVVGDVSPAEVEKAAAVLSQQVKSPAWVAELPTPPPPELRAPGGERMLSVVTARPGTLADIRVGCLLPPMGAADRGHYELLQHAMEARLNSSLRIEQGDGYGVDVDYQRLRDGTTYLTASTFVDDQALPRALAALRAQWQRWTRDGFDAGEISVARWRYAGSLSSIYASPNALAARLLGEWSAEPAALGAETLRPELTGLRAGRVAELFATCKANAVLGLTGNEAQIRRALETAWPGLRAAPHRAPAE